MLGAGECSAGVSDPSFVLPKPKNKQNDVFITSRYFWKQNMKMSGLLKQYTKHTNR